MANKTDNAGLARSIWTFIATLELADLWTVYLGLGLGFGGADALSVLATPAPIAILGILSLPSFFKHCYGLLKFIITPPEDENHEAIKRLSGQFLNGLFWQSVPVLSYAAALTGCAFVCAPLLVNSSLAFIATASASIASVAATPIIIPALFAGVFFANTALGIKECYNLYKENEAGKTIPNFKLKLGFTVAVTIGTGLTGVCVVVGLLLPAIFALAGLAFPPILGAAAMALAVVSITVMVSCIFARMYVNHQDPKPKVSEMSQPLLGNDANRDFAPTSTPTLNADNNSLSASTVADTNGIPTTNPYNNSNNTSGMYAVDPEDAPQQRSSLLNPIYKN